MKTLSMTLRDIDTNGEYLHSTIKVEIKEGNHSSLATSLLEKLEKDLNKLLCEKELAEVNFRFRQKH